MQALLLLLLAVVEEYLVVELSLAVENSLEMLLLQVKAQKHFSQVELS